MSTPLKEMLPSKSFFITIGSAILIIVLVLVIMAAVQRKKENIKPVISTEVNRLLTTEEAARNIQILEQLDTDGDGLYDWEEALWGTDPMKADSDDDGIMDAEEVKEVKEEYDLDENTTPLEELTQIDLLSRDLYSTVAILGEQGQLEESQDKIAESFEEVIVNAFNYNLFSVNDLNLGPQNQEVIDEYSQNIRRIVNSNMTEENDFIFVANNANKTVKTPESLAVIEKYTNYLEDMMGLVVPVEWQEPHLDVVNGIVALTSAFEAILYSDQDPLLGASAVLRLGEIVDYYSEALTELIG